jgi:hypothetical protein
MQAALSPRVHKNRVQTTVLEFGAAATHEDVLQRISDSFAEHRPLIEGNVVELHPALNDAESHRELDAFMRYLVQNRLVEGLVLGFSDTRAFLVQLKEIRWVVGVRRAPGRSDIHFTLLGQHKN